MSVSIISHVLNDVRLEQNLFIAFCAHALQTIFVYYIKNHVGKQIEQIKL